MSVGEFGSVTVRRPRRCGADGEDGRRPRRDGEDGRRPLRRDADADDGRLCVPSGGAGRRPGMLDWWAAPSTRCPGLLAWWVGPSTRRTRLLAWWAAPWPARVEVFPLGCGATSSCASRRPRLAACRLTWVLAGDLAVGRIRGGLQRRPSRWGAGDLGVGQVCVDGQSAWDGGRDYRGGRLFSRYLSLSVEISRD
jgi:hypothetical protein